MEAEPTYPGVGVYRLPKLKVSRLFEVLPGGNSMIALKLEVPRLSIVDKVVCRCPHLVSLLRALTPEELLTPMKPAEWIDGTTVSWKVELVEAWDNEPEPAPWCWYGRGAIDVVL